MTAILKFSQSYYTESDDTH